MSITILNPDYRQHGKCILVVWNGYLTLKVLGLNPWFDKLFLSIIYARWGGGPHGGRWGWSGA
jgi:hypothetical protein